MENSEEKAAEGKKTPKKRGPLGCLFNIVIVVVVVVLLVNGIEWLFRWLDPEANNEAAVKAKGCSSAYMCAGRFGEPIGGALGEKAKKEFGDCVLSVLDYFMAEDDKETVDTGELNAILTSEYTLKDAEALAEYTGRKIKLTGKIVQRTGNTAELVTDVNFDTSSEKWPVTVWVDCSWIKAKPETDDCVEIDGILIVDPGDFSSKESMRVEVNARKIQEADYAAIGGNPENSFMYQKMKPFTSVEKGGLTLDILGVSVDAATGRGYVKYRVSKDTAETRENYDLEIFGAKGSLSGCDFGIIGMDGRKDGGLLISESDLPFAEQIGAGDGMISFVVCAYEMKEENEDERVLTVNPGADIYMRVDIPGEAWNVYEEN